MNTVALIGRLTKDPEQMGGFVAVEGDIPF